MATRNINRIMNNYLPRYYDDFLIVTNIVDVESAEMEGVSNEIAKVLDQYFVDTATTELKRWERICGIPMDESRSLSDRRAEVKAKLRGFGTVTVAKIKNIVEAFAGDSNVEEQYSDYNVKIIFIEIRGEPKNVNDIKKTLRNIIPAHLGISYEYTYLIWNELDEMKHDWEDIDAASISWDKLEVINPSYTGDPIKYI